MTLTMAQPITGNELNASQGRVRIQPAPPQAVKNKVKVGKMRPLVNWSAVNYWHNRSSGCLTSSWNGEMNWSANWSAVSYCIYYTYRYTDHLTSLIEGIARARRRYIYSLVRNIYLSLYSSIPLAELVNWSETPERQYWQ